MQYAVMIECRDGTRQLVNDTWEERFHVVTWTVEDDAETAEREAAKHRENRREVHRAWVEVRP